MDTRHSGDAWIRAEYDPADGRFGHGTAGHEIGPSRHVCGEACGSLYGEGAVAHAPGVRYAQRDVVPPGWESNARDLSKIVDRVAGKARGSDFIRWIHNKTTVVEKYLRGIEEHQRYPDGTRLPAAKVALNKLKIFEDEWEQWDDQFSAALAGAANKSGAAAKSLGAQILWLMKDFERCKIGTGQFKRAAESYAKIFGGG